MGTTIEVGRLLTASTTQFVIGCSVGTTEVPPFGCLVRVPLSEGYQIFGLIYDVGIRDDGLVRQLVAAGNVTDEVVRDNRERRIVPVEISVLVLGLESNGIVRHQLPPRPPLSLDQVYLCDREDLLRFSGSGRPAYLRHLLRVPDLPLGDLLAAHVQQVRAIHPDPRAWTASTVREIISLLRDDYPTLTSVLSSLQVVLEATAADKGG